MKTINKKICATLRDGYTLVELLLVIVILGILIGVAVPLFLGQRTRAVHSEAKSNLESLRLLAEQYYAENGVYYTTDGTYTYRGTYGSADNGIEDFYPGFRPGDISSLQFTYNLTISGNGTQFNATATGKGGGAGTVVFWINQDNNRGGF